MRIVLTGGSGFLGKIFLNVLSPNHELITLGRNQSNQIRVDLARQVPELPPADLIIHAAGKAHIIPKSEGEIREFWNVNKLGTIHLLEGIKDLPKSLIFISTVAVYGMEEGHQIDESQALKGESPYAQSKIEAEKLVQEWGEKNQVPVLILRLPLVVGENPPGNLGAMIKAISRGYYRRIGKGESKKSMVLGSDIATAIPIWIGKSGVFNLTDGENPTLLELDKYLASCLGGKVKIFPLSLLKGLAKIGDLISFFPLNSYRIKKLEQSLTFSDQRARQVLLWKPRPVIGNFKPTK